MAIIDNSTEQEKDSPFYKKLKGQIKQWEDFALANEGRLRGSFNVYKTKMEVDFPKIGIKIKGCKQQYTVGTDNWMAKSSNLSERTEFRKKVQPKNSKFEIFKPSWFTRFFLLFSSNYSRIDSDYFIRFEEGITPPVYIEFFHTIQNAAPSYQIHRIKMTENELSLTYQRFISASSDLKKIFEALEDVSIHTDLYMKA